ncbi:unnamed protein product [Oncorhynchus mykiss]|uniref:Hemimethylated DNA-binding domain-containing protein n=1 Tax=Oncorhynchus mykiss TaxID=8022 RepID=A0A060XUM8_ONCMY|nr:unnamed protein product [Oncorhynchus mykiss]
MEAHFTTYLPGDVCVLQTSQHGNWGRTTNVLSLGNCIIRKSGHVSHALPNPQENLVFRGSCSLKMESAVGKNDGTVRPTVVFCFVDETELGSIKVNAENTPHYKVLFSGPGPSSLLVGYLPQTRLERVTGTRPEIPTLEQYFTHFDGERFIMQPWLQEIFPED